MQIRGWSVECRPPATIPPKFDGTHVWNYAEHTDLSRK
jgi:hypothetical protein